MPTVWPPSHSVSRAASPSSARLSRVADLPQQGHPDRAGRVLHPAADDPSVHPGGGADVAVAVEQSRGMGPEIETPLLPAHHRRVEHGEQRDPRARIGHRLQVVGEHPAGAAAVQGHLDRGHIRQRTAYGALGRPQPPHQVGLGAGAEGAQPATDQGRVALLDRCRRGDLGEPVLHERPPRPREPPVLGVAAPHDVGGSAQVGQDPAGAPHRSGGHVDLDGDLRHPLAQVQGREPARSPASSSRTPARASSSQASPSVASPARTRPWPAACALSPRPAPTHSPKPPAGGRGETRRACVASRAA